VYFSAIPAGEPLGSGSSGPPREHESRHALNLRSVFTRGFSLVLLNVVTVIAPLARMVLQTRMLSAFELGFASALSATYSTFELITDIAMYKYVFLTERSEFDAALASAHGLSLVRGIAAGGLALAVTPAIAASLSLGYGWPSFALLALAIAIRSLEHLEVRVAERDYRYTAQFNANIISAVVGLAAMYVSARIRPDHTIFLSLLIAQNLSYVIVSHWLATRPYRINFHNAHFRQAWTYALPLIFNGIGLAIMSQGDRLLVGTVLDVPTLGLYSVFVVVTTVPTGAALRIASSIFLAGLANCGADAERRKARLEIYSRATLAMGACFAFGIIGLASIVVPLVFGRRFVLSEFGVLFLAVATFFRIARNEPATSQLHVENRTRALALANQSTVVGLVASFVLAALFKNVESVLAGRMVGEIFAALVTHWFAPGREKSGERGDVRPALWAASTIGLAMLIVPATPGGDGLLGRISMIGIVTILLVLGLSVNIRPLIIRAFRRAAP
jgi:O-antigen/teichoic acid export membrane protein